MALLWAKAVAAETADPGRGMQPVPVPNVPAPQGARPNAAKGDVGTLISSGRRIALAIGNSAYGTTPLKNPRRDAETVAQALRRTGFHTVQVAADLGREKLLNELQAFAREADDAEWALIYFAGHGVEINGVNYLVPTDARLKIDRDVLFEAVPLDLALAAVEGAQGLRLVLLDACRDNPFVGAMRRTATTRTIGTGLAPVATKGGTLVVYATRHGQVALDGAGENSPFAAALARRLPTPGADIRKVLGMVRDDVLQATGNKQSPFAYGSLNSADLVLREND